MGEVHHSEWRLSASDSMIQGQEGGTAGLDIQTLKLVQL